MTSPKTKLRYSGTDTRSWKVVTFAGKAIRVAGKALIGFDGYKSANEIAVKVGGVAVRA